MVESALVLQLRQMIKSLGIAVPQLAERLGVNIDRLNALLAGSPITPEEVDSIQASLQAIQRQGVLVGKQREISEDDANKARELVEPVFGQQLYPMYLVDVNFRVWYANDLILMLIGKDRQFEAEVSGKITTLDLLCDNRFGIRQLVDPLVWEEFMQQQLTRMILLITAYYGDEGCQKIVGEHVSQYDDLIAPYVEAQQSLRSRKVVGRSNLTFKIGGKKICFALVPDQISEDPRFFLMEFHPQDVVSAHYVEQLRAQLSPEKERISLTDVSQGLRSWGDLSALAQLSICLLDGFANIAKRENISVAQVVHNAITSVIDSLHPVESATGNGIRSKKRLKYEILRMMAYEGATEEQMMWDLGFDTDFDPWLKNNEEKSREPRYPYRGKGDYAATSRASFKRLKSQAIEDVRCRLEELERRVSLDGAPS